MNMRAVQVTEHGGVDALQIVERPVPEPGPGEVRVRIHAAGLNHLDLWVRRGVPGVRYPLPLILGCDGAGVVDACGDGVKGIEPGMETVLAPGTSCGLCERCSSGDDNLCRFYGILGENRHGTCADYCVVPAANILPKPPALSFVEAAALPLVYLTAWHMLVYRARVQAGDTVLIHAAGSGVSSAGIQIAKLLGAEVLATAGTQEKLDRARALGADVVINYRETSFRDVVKKHTGKRGVDVVFDHVGKDLWEDNIVSLTQGGRFVICGNTSGPRAETPIPHVFFKNLSILGSTMGSRAELHRVMRLVNQGKLKPVVHTDLPLESIAEGHRILEQREAFGKVVMRLDS